MSLFMLSGLDLSGVEKDDYESVGSKKSRAARKEKRQGKRAPKKEARQSKRSTKKETRKAKGAGKKAGRKAKRAEGKGFFSKVAKVAAAPARAAFLTLISVNALKVADKLLKAWKKDPRAVEIFWNKAGGKLDALKKAIAKGSKSSLSGAEVGVALEAVLATATPIVIAALALFKKLGVFEKKEDANEMETAIEEGKEALDNDPNVEKVAAEMPDNGGEITVMQPYSEDSEGGGGEAPTRRTSTDTSVEETAEDKEIDETKMNYTPYIIGGVALLGIIAAVMFSKKK